MNEDICTEDSTLCPYCAKSSGCEHVLLVVDRTFRTAEGGTCMDGFNQRWSMLFDDADDDFDEREAFETLLEEVDAVADFSTEFDFEGGPGMSSGYSVYYVKSTEDAHDAVARFLDGGST